MILRRVAQITRAPCEEGEDGGVVTAPDAQ